jgi:hypothetical protein
MLKAAIEAAPFSHPQLKATAVLLGSDFATRLEAAVKRSNAAKLIEVQPSLSDHKIELGIWNERNSALVLIAIVLKHKQPNGR